MLRPYVVTVSSEKGGVGKTTLATNLAIYLKALNEEMPVTLFSFDNHFSVDRMFRIGRREPRGDVLTLLSGQSVEDVVETGEYGVQFIPSSRRLTTATWAPASARAWAIARPRPRLPPVTTATRRSRRKHSRTDIRFTPYRLRICA